MQPRAVQGFAAQAAGAGFRLSCIEVFGLLLLVLDFALPLLNQSYASFLVSVLEYRELFSILAQCVFAAYFCEYQS